jgi:hypothetical protein
LEDVGADEYKPRDKVFNSDSETSLNSEATSTCTNGSNGPKITPNPIDYANYTKLFEKKPSVESLATKSSSSFILEDYNSFKKKIATKKSLHK